MRFDQKGFSGFELVIVLAVVAIIGVVGYSLYNRQNTPTVSSSTAVPSTSTPAAAQQSATANVPSAPSITTSSDLNKAEATLDNTDPAATNASDSGQLDSQSNGF